VLAVLGVEAGQHPVLQLSQQLRPDRLPPRADHGRGRQPVRPLPRHGSQVPQQGLRHIGVIGVRHQRHQQGVPDRQRRRHRPPRLSFHLAVQPEAAGDLPDHAGLPGQGIQPVLGHAQPRVTGRVAGRLHPPVAAYHGRRDDHRLEEHHQVPGRDLRRARGDQRRAAISARPGRPGQVCGPDRKHARQARSGIFPARRRDIGQHGRVEGHEEAPGRRG